MNAKKILLQKKVWCNTDKINEQKSTEKIAQTYVN